MSDHMNRPYRSRFTRLDRNTPRVEDYYTTVSRRATAQASEWIGATDLIQGAEQLCREQVPS